MAFTPKAWEDDPSTDTPLSAAALIDLEQRLAAYADSVAAGGVELGHARITSSPAAATTTVTDITGLSVTVTVGMRPIVVEAYLPTVQQLTGTGSVAAALYEGATLLQLDQHTLTVNQNSAFNPKVRLAPSAGSHTYKVRISTSANTASIFADALFPAYIQVVEV
jgi:hypothetical protein